MSNTQTQSSMVKVWSKDLKKKQIHTQCYLLKKKHIPNINFYSLYGVRYQFLALHQKNYTPTYFTYFFTSLHTKTRFLFIYNCILYRKIFLKTKSMPNRNCGINIYL